MIAAAPLGRSARWIDRVGLVIPTMRVTGGCSSGRAAIASPSDRVVSPGAKAGQTSRGSAAWARWPDRPANVSKSDATRTETGQPSKPDRKSITHPT
jgi:hypothetical protein